MLRDMLEIPARHWRPLSVLALLSLTVLSLLPMPDGSPVPGNDKALHLVAWGLAVTPGALALGRRVAPVAGVFLAWSLGIELLQPLTGRHCEAADMLANTAGLALGIVAGNLLRRQRG